MKPTLRDRSRWLAPVLKSSRFWLSLGGLAAGLGLLFVLFNVALMPLWTRHGAEIQVPEVRQLAAEDAVRALERAGLRPEMREQPFNPNIAADVVVDQIPLPNTGVKPGRRVYYYVNASPKEMVEVPSVTSKSEGVARADLEAAGLIVGQVLMDSVRTPYENTVTRQTPQGGHAVPKGTRVTLWLSPGIGRTRVRVPDVTDLVPSEARRVILEAGLWVESPDARGDTVRWQEPRPGQRLREGEEVRIHTTEPPEGWNPRPTPPREPQADSAVTPAPEPPEEAEDVEGDDPPPPPPSPVEPAPLEEVPEDVPPPLPPPTSDDDGDDTSGDEGGESAGESSDGER